MKKQKVNSKETPKDMSFIVTVLLLLIGGMICLFISAKIPDSQMFWQYSFNTLASALIVAGIFSAINEKLLKETTIDTILTKLSLKKDIDSMGIISVCSNIKEIKYKDYFKQANKNIDIVHVYGRTWTTNHQDDLSEKLRKSNCRIRVVLVSPDSPFIKGLADFYNLTEDKLLERVQESIDMWKELNKQKKIQKKSTTQSSIDLYLHKGQPAYSLYRFDDTIVNIQNSVSKSIKSSKLPCIVCVDTSKEEDFYSIFKNDIEEIVKQSDKYVF